MQGTWADHVIIQAVTDAMNFIIYVIESVETFSDVTLVQTSDMIQNPRSVYLGHMGEMHYISTVSILSQTNSKQANSDRNLPKVSDPSDNISNYQKKKKTEMRLHLKSLLIIFNVQTKKIYQAIVTMKKIHVEALI